jgi:hypothetical protein
VLYDGFMTVFESIDEAEQFYNRTLI